MKQRIRIAVLVLLGIALPVFGWTAAVSAGSVKTGDNAVIEADQTLERTVFMSGDTIEVAGTVDGDVFCAGQSVNITGTVRGDVICAGQTVRVGGTVEGDVRVAGQQVTLSGQVEGNATIAAQTFTLAEEAVVNDLTIGASIANIDGEVERDVYIGATTATVNGLVARDVQAAVERLTLGSDARVGGDVVYPREAELDRAEGAQVVGELNQYRIDNEGQGDDFTAGQIIGGVIFALLLMLVTAMAIAALFPRVLQRVSQHAMDKPGMTFLIGLATVFLTPVLIVGLMITGIGFLLGIILLLAFLLLLLVSGPVAGYYIGRMMLTGKSTNPLLYMLLGAGLLVLAYFIPYLGGLIMLVAGALGSGMVVREIFRRGKNIRYDVSAMNVKPAKAKK